MGVTSWCKVLQFAFFLRKPTGNDRKIPEQFLAQNE